MIEAHRPARWSAKVSLTPDSGVLRDQTCTTYGPKLIRGKLTFGERVVLHRAGNETRRIDTKQGVRGDENVAVLRGPVWGQARVESTPCMV